MNVTEKGIWIVVGVMFAVAIVTMFYVSYEPAKKTAASVKTLLTENSGNRTDYYSKIRHQNFTATSTEWTKATRVYGTECHISDVAEPGLPGYRTFGSTADNPTEWFDVSGKTNKKVGWIKHQSLGPGPTKIIQEIRPAGNCSSW